MSTIRCYCDSITRPVTEIVGSEAHHIANVMRLREGDKAEIFDGKGMIAQAVIEKVSSKQVSLRIESFENRQKPGRGEIVIAASIAKGERFEWLIGKCTELGVNRIVPVIFERTVKQPKNPKINERWRKIAISAAKQCKRLFLPEIDKPMEFTEAVKSLREKYFDADIFWGSLEKEAKSLVEQKFNSNGVAVFVGPEGGISETEKQLLRESGWKAVKLTDTVLRVETAGVAFAAILSAKRNSKNPKTILGN